MTLFFCKVSSKTMAGTLVIIQHFIFLSKFYADNTHKRIFHLGWAKSCANQPNTIVIKVKFIPIWSLI